LRLPFSSPPTTRRVAVEVFDPASTRVTGLLSESVRVRVTLRLLLASRYIASGRTSQKTLAIDVHYCRVLLYVLPNNGLFTKILSPRDGVYRAVT
jgi:hypothetical protein